ncbi:MAG: heavy metal sensor histidine kinase [Acidobacteria bacterium]|nr:heavy metal sensor histidine kinase [Acidobacteriota bacterium]
MARPSGKTSFLRGLRVRLTIVNALVMTGLLVALGLFFHNSLQQILDQQTREVLEEEWSAVKSYITIYRNAVDWQWDPDDPDETAAVQRLQEIYFIAGVNGRAMPLENNKGFAVSATYQTLGLQSPEEIKRIIASKGQLWEVRTDPDGEPFQIRGGVIIDDDRPFFLAIGRSLATNRQTLNEFTRNYVRLLPLLVLSSILVGWFVAGRGISPVHELAQAAERISGTNLSLRIPPRGSGDELDNLINTFNNMVERLERSFLMTRQFSTDVSHELRTPLTAIRGQIEVALFTADTKEQYREAMLNALEDVERLSQTVRAMLLLSQAESGQLLLQKSRLDLGAEVTDLVEQFQLPADEARLEMRHEVIGPAWILADRVQIGRMISNLLTNALKYTPAGGKVMVRVLCVEDRVVFEVEDTGVGIAAEFLPHIFDRFYRVPGSSKEKQGLGLGLSFVAWIVKAHDGTLDVDSRKGEGTRFRITFAAAPAVEAPPSEVSASADSATRAAVHPR